MPVVIHGGGTIEGIAVGGLPDGTVDADMLASNAVTSVKILDDAITGAKIAGSAVTSGSISGTGSIGSALIVMTFGLLLQPIRVSDMRAHIIKLTFLLCISFFLS